MENGGEKEGVMGKDLKILGMTHKEFSCITHVR